MYVPTAATLVQASTASALSKFNPVQPGLSEKCVSWSCSFAQWLPRCLQDKVAAPEFRQLTFLQHTDPAAALNYRLPDVPTSPCLGATHGLFLCQEAPTPSNTNLRAASASQFHVLLLTPLHVTPRPLTPLGRARLRSPGILCLTPSGHLQEILSLACGPQNALSSLWADRGAGSPLSVHSLLLGICCTEWGMPS